MDMIRLAFEALFPLLCYMAVGYALRLLHFFHEQTLAEIDKLVFKLLLPLTIFSGICDASLTEAFDGTVALFVAAFSIVSFLLLAWLVPRRMSGSRDIPVAIQGIHKSNYNLLAIPIASSFFGDSIGMTAVLMAIITPIVNVCSALIFEAYCGEKTGAVRLARKILLNPMVLSSLLGIAFSLTGISIPPLLKTGVLKKLSAMSTPLALIALGATFDLSSARAHAGKLLAVSTCKLLVMPACALSLAALIGIRGVNLLAIAIFSGAPAAVNTYSTAVSMGGNGRFAGEIVALTSIASLLTMFLWLCLLGTLHLL